MFKKVYYIADILEFDSDPAQPKSDEQPTRCGSVRQLHHCQVDGEEAARSGIQSGGHLVPSVLRGGDSGDQPQYSLLYISGGRCPPEERRRPRGHSLPAQPSLSDSCEGSGHWQTCSLWHPRQSQSGRVPQDGSGETS